MYPWLASWRCEIGCEILKSWPNDHTTNICRVLHNFTLIYSLHHHNRKKQNMYYPTLIMRKAIIETVNLSKNTVNNWQNQELSPGVLIQNPGYHAVSPRMLTIFQILPQSSWQHSGTYQSWVFNDSGKGANRFVPVSLENFLNHPICFMA